MGFQTYIEKRITALTASAVNVSRFHVPVDGTINRLDLFINSIAGGAIANHKFQFRINGVPQFLDVDRLAVGPGTTHAEKTGLALAVVAGDVLSWDYDVVGTGIITLAEYMATIDDGLTTPTSIAALTDVDVVPGPNNGDVLKWITANGKWEPQAEYAVAGPLDDLLDVDVAGADQWDFLVFDGFDWVPIAGIVDVDAGTGIAIDKTDTRNPIIAASIASQAEAEAGVNTAKLTTPQRVAQAIAALGQNLTKATQVEAEAGTENTHYMTPLRAAQAIAALASGGGGGPTALIKAATESRSTANTGNTMTADATLQFTTVINSVYLVEGMLFFVDNGANIGAQFRYNHAQAPTLMKMLWEYSPQFVLTPATTAFSSTKYEQGQTGGATNITASSFFAVVRFKGKFKSHATIASLFSIDWAQLTNQAANLDLELGSYLRYQKL